jgi:type IV pilus assembly protein PilA
MSIMKKLGGFALLESAISTVVLSGYLLSYQHEQINKQLITDALNYSKSSQVAVAKYFEKNGILPTNNAQANLPDNNTFTNSDYQNDATLQIGEFGQIIITISDNANNNKNAGTNDISNQTIILEPNINQGSITWSCRSGSLDNMYRPENCYKKDIVDTVEESETLDYLEDTNYL